MRIKAVRLIFVINSEIKMNAAVKMFYKSDSKNEAFIEEASPNPNTFTFQHRNADAKDLESNLAVAEMLNRNGFSIIIREHVLNQGKQPELEIIYANGKKVISDVKTPDPKKY